MTRERGVPGFHGHSPGPLYRAGAMIDPRPTTEQPDDDPWLWLEEIDGSRALEWVTAQTAATMTRYADARFETDRDAIRDILDRPDNIPGITRRGGMLYNFWRDAASPRGLWRRTTMDEYRTAAPRWEVLLDLDALATAEGEDWIWQGAHARQGDGRAIVRLSRGGGDAAVLREFDLTARAFVPGGFMAPEAKGEVAWLDRDALLLSSALGEGMATNSGYARTVRLWHRGQSPIEAQVIHEVPATFMAVSAEIDRESAGEPVLFIERPTFIDSVYRPGDRSGPGEAIDRPADSWIAWQRGWVAIRVRTPWNVGGVTYAADTVLGLGLADFRAGDRRFSVLFTPGDRRSLQGFFWCDDKLVLAILDNLAPVFEILVPAANWRRATLATLPKMGVVSVWPLDAEEIEQDGTLLVNAQDPLTPQTLLCLGDALAHPTVLRQAPQVFSAPGAVVSRHEAVSTDGERIPYFQTGPAALTGDAPVHMTGYGGFGISSLPYYRSVGGKLWLEQGGTTVVACIRGGGEFGTRWHEAGRRAGKSLAHDDFAAVAADLARRGVTRPNRIAAEGGSNGGLLIANMLVRYPERFGALLCAIPLIDMRRYTKLLAGASWVAEYGDPDNPDDWAFIRRFSAYHAAGPDRAYPPMLLTTSRRDDRVHPGHARKMAAKLRALGYTAYFHEPAAGGHGYGKDNQEIATSAALGVAFLRHHIGWGT
jgi:prolyl oligopeptidase